MWTPTFVLSPKDVVVLNVSGEKAEWGVSFFRLISKLRSSRVLVNSHILHRVHHPIIW